MNKLNSVLNSINEGLEGFNRKVDDFNRKTKRSLAVQQAMSDLKLHVYVEQSVIETAVKMAQSGLELQENLKSPTFRQAYEQVQKTLASTTDANRTREYVDSPVPTFERIQRNPDPEVEEAVVKAIEELRGEREAFLSGVRTRLSANANLRVQFLSALEELKGVRYLAALDPKSN